MRYRVTQTVKSTQFQAVGDILFYDGDNLAHAMSAVASAMALDIVGHEVQSVKTEYLEEE